MKKFILFLFLSLCSNAQLTKLVFEMPKMPVFDGVAEASWNSPWESINKIWIPLYNLTPFTGYSEPGTKTLLGDNDFSGRYQVMWNDKENVLLLFVEIQDDNFIDGYSKPSTNYPNFDVLEVFVDENRSGGDHLFDTLSTNAENAFAYHIAVNKPPVNQINTSMVGAMDIKGTSSTDVVDYQFHFPNFAFKNNGNGKYTYELSLRLYLDDYNHSYPSLSIKNLFVAQGIGLSIAYSDNDDPDGLRDHFIGSVLLNGLNNNNSYQDASIFGNASLAGVFLDTPNHEKENLIKLYPNPFQNSFLLQINDSLQLENSFLEIYNQFGQKIFEKNISEHSSLITPNFLAKGTYYYRFTNANNQVKHGYLISN